MGKVVLVGKMAGKEVFSPVGLFILLFCSTCLAFNLDTSVPIVKEGISSDSYFGFSVAQHQIFQHTTGGTEHVLLVGAPRDNITSSTASSAVRRLVRPGALYSCPISSFNDDCEQLEVFQENPSSKEDRNDQWFGVSVSSQGTKEGKAVVCAHRYKVTNYRTYVWGQGICQALTNTLDEDMVLQPCANKPREEGHGQYGFCQAGSSVTIDENSNDVLIGVPGPYNWRGTVFKNIIPDGLETMIWYNSPVETIPQGEVGPDPATNYYSYLGSTVKVGRVVENRRTYLAGAPRSALGLGEVLLFTEGSNIQLSIEPRYRLKGDLFGSGFGSALEVVDINGDGLEDIIVGAPYYHGDGIGGAIFIFMNDAEGITSETKPIKVVSRKMNQSDCKAVDCQNARFGFSISSLKDLDQDGYNDIAVGAPYEGDGVVYVFRGSDKGLLTDFSQRVSASELPTARPLTSFGYSLSGGNDMDGNGYPDLVVGSFASNKALVLRTRPVVNIYPIMIAEPDKINPLEKLCVKDNKDNICFKLRVCFKFSAEPKEQFQGRIDLEYKVEAERFTGKSYSRVSFKDADNDMPHIIEKSIKLNEQSNTHYRCREEDVNIGKYTKDFLNPIEFRLTYKLKEQLPPTMIPGQNLPNINLYPVLNDKAAKYDLPVDFVKSCGTDQVCHSNLELISYFELARNQDGDPVLKVGQDKELRLSIQVRNNGEDAHEAALSIILPDSIDYINIEVDPAETGLYSCTPYDKTVLCSLGNPLRKNRQARFVVRLDARDIEPTLKQLDVHLRVNTTSTETDESDDYKHLAVQVKVETDMLVRGSSSPSREVFYGGEIIGESAVMNETQIGRVVVHTYEIKNDGHGKIANSTVHISWPFEVENGYPQGKHLLYLMEPPKIDKGGFCNLDPRFINPLQVTIDPDSTLEGLERLGAIKSREKRDVESERNRQRREAIIPYKYVNVKGKSLKVVTMSCDGKPRTAKCLEFQCYTGTIMPQKSVVIRLRARLWNSTFLEDYRNVDQVHIFSKARLELDPSLNIRQTTLENDVDSALTVAIPDIKIKEPPKVPLWVIILAACAGLLILIVIIILLWKCGFFKRRKPGEPRTLRAKKQKKKHMNHYYEEAYS